MWKKGRTLIVCMFAAVWWGVFYPELCFMEETCEIVQEQDAQGRQDAVDRDNAAKRQDAPEGKEAVGKSGADQAKISGEIDASAVWGASGDEIVISSRFFEWCKENLTERKD